MVVENPGLSAPDLPVWRLSGPELVIGVAAGEPAYELYGATYGLRLDDGRIVVANAGTDELRFYGADGAHLLNVGREGGGPGEYAAIRGLTRLPGDSIAVWDWSLKRLAVYDARGALGRVLTPRVLTAFVPRLVGAFDDGTLIVTGGFDPGAARAAVPGVREDSITLLRLDPVTGALLDSIGRFPGTQEQVHSGAEGFSVRPVLLGRQELVSAGGDRVCVGDDRTGEITVFGPDRQLRLIRTGPPRYPRSLPSSPIGSAGSGWLTTRSTGTVRPWTVLDPNGRLLARIDLPLRLTPLDAVTDYLLGQLRDALDVERVVLYRLDRR